MRRCAPQRRERNICARGDIVWYARCAMGFQKLIVVLSGSGSTGLLKLSGSFDGVSKVRAECRCDAVKGEAKLYIIADEVTELKLDAAKTVLEMPISAKGDVACMLVTNGKTLLGSSGGRVDRRQLEGRIEAAKREQAKLSRAAQEKKGHTAPAVEKGVGGDPRQGNAAPPSVENAYAANAAKNSPAPLAEDCGAPQDADKRAEETRSAPARGRFDAPPVAPFAPVNAASEPSVQGVLRDGVTYDGTNFYQAVKPQIDEMFVRYPAEATLNALVPNSKWVRVDVDADDYYVLGVLFDIAEPTFICYGIPGKKTVPPPAEIAGACVWLPLDTRRPEGEGYWVIYQSAVNGKCIK